MAMLAVGRVDVVRFGLFPYLDLQSHVRLGVGNSALLKASGLPGLDGRRVVIPGIWKKAVRLSARTSSDQFHSFCSFAAPVSLTLSAPSNK